MLLETNCEGQQRAGNSPSVSGCLDPGASFRKHSDATRFEHDVSGAGRGIRRRKRDDNCTLVWSNGTRVRLTARFAANCTPNCQPCHQCTVDRSTRGKVHAPLARAHGCAVVGGAPAQRGQESILPAGSRQLSLPRGLHGRAPGILNGTSAPRTRHGRWSAKRAAAPTPRLTAPATQSPDLSFPPAAPARTPRPIRS
jgi:hypothetical protein